jgi:hypothetical protein
MPADAIMERSYHEGVGKQRLSQSGWSDCRTIADRTPSELLVIQKSVPCLCFTESPGPTALSCQTKVSRRLSQGCSADKQGQSSDRSRLALNSPNLHGHPQLSAINNVGGVQIPREPCGRSPDVITRGHCDARENFESPIAVRAASGCIPTLRRAAMPRSAWISREYSQPTNKDEGFMH